MDAEFRLLQSTFVNCPQMAPSLMVPAVRQLHALRAVIREHRKSAFGTDVPVGGPRVAGFGLESDRGEGAGCFCPQGLSPASRYEDYLRLNAFSE